MYHPPKFGYVWLLAAGRGPSGSWLNWLSSS
jgi:hypothetical protein